MSVSSPSNIIFFFNLKLGQFFVWVQAPPGSNRNPELHCVSRHARLYSQLLGTVE